MNFLSEVLATVESTQMAHVKNKTSVISAEISRLKCEVKTYMENAQVNLKSMKKRNGDLLHRANRLNTEMRELNDQVENLTRKDLDNCATEIANYREDLQASTFRLKLVSQLLAVNEHKKQVAEFTKQARYCDAIKTISAMKQLVHEIPEDEQLDIVQALVVSLAIDQQSVLHAVAKVWAESVITEAVDVDNDHATLSIRIDSSRSEDIGQSIRALCFDSSYVFELQRLASFLMADVFTAVISHRCSTATASNDVYTTLTIDVVKTGNRSPYTEVFQNIRSVVDFLNATVNVELQPGVMLLGYVGQRISDEFCELLIKNCLADTVPTSAQGLDQYNTEVVGAIERLQTFLVECHFFAPDNRSILEYANNVDMLFANKTCQTYLDRAMGILRKDLHDMVEVGNEPPTSDVVQANFNTFPKCCVSRSTCTYLELLREMLGQASTASDMCASRLVYTVTQIIGLYASLLPEYHRKLLETIPQQVALYHNNCLYFAHELATLNTGYGGTKCNRAVSEESFTSQAQMLQTTGAKYFLRFMQTQTRQMEDILRESALSQLGQTDHLDVECEKHVRQCLRLLELLKTVWQRVLSYDMYNRTIGDLLNSLVDCLVRLVVGVEDISAENCTTLVNVYGVVKTRAPKLFTEPKEINLYTKHWYKFNELILMLGASLADINDRWADGKGPLAVEFKPEEVKGLIRALFQNTDRRSAVLARIV